jgi:hypothetical protein
VPEEVIARQVRGDACLPALERLDIYRYAYWVRQIDALRDEFRRLAERMGQQAFAELMTQYLRAHPSEDASIERVGRRLEAFLRAHPDERCRAHADLAALEWAEVEVLLAEDPAAVVAAFDVPPEHFPACRVILQPAWRLLVLASDPLATLGRPEAPHAPTAIAIWRKRFSVRHRTLESDEHHAAAAVRAGATMAAVCDTFAGATDPAKRAFDVFRRWLSEGWVSHIVRPNDEELRP